MRTLFSSWPARCLLIVAVCTFTADLKLSSAAIYSVQVATDSGAGSLRQAILDANASLGVDQIRFEISGSGPHTIQPLSALPSITDSVTIDGYTQPGASPATQAGDDDAVLLIELDGSLLNSDAPGLDVNATGVTVKGLVINGFNGSGIVVEYGITGAVIQGNYLGPDVDRETLIGNGGQGVEVLGNNNLVGGSCAGCGNVIAGNVEDGVFVLDNSIRDTVSGNSIFSNGPKDPSALGIDLYVLGTHGVNQNDNACDNDVAGGNLLQNFPVLTSASSDGTVTQVGGYLYSVSEAQFTVEIFANASCDVSRFGEGERYLGALPVNVLGGCLGEFSTAFPLGLADGVQMTATATDANGNTSEFSECFRVDGPQPHDLAVAKMKAPKRITLSEKTPSATKPLKLTIQNRSPHDEIIANPDALRGMMTVLVDSLPPEECPDAPAVLVLPAAFPITLPPKGKLNLTYNLTFDCANDPLASGETTPHGDFRVSVTVSHGAIGSESDSHPADDVCPHAALPGQLDPYPDGRVKDKGCGGKNSDGSLGADVVIDIVRK
jgi:hypothetical protein